MITFLKLRKLCFTAVKFVLVYSLLVVFTIGATNHLIPHTLADLSTRCLFTFKSVSALAELKFVAFLVALLTLKSKHNSVSEVKKVRMEVRLKERKSWTFFSKFHLYPNHLVRVNNFNCREIGFKMSLH